MKVQLKRIDDFVETTRLVIRIGTKEYRLSENQFEELVVNKYETEDGETAIVIRPITSNEIRIS